MKKLALKHAFMLARIIKAANIRDEIVKFAGELHSGMTVDEIGLEFAVVMIQAAADEKAEKKIYELYAELKDVKPEEVAEYDFATVKADMKVLVEENDLKSFFQSVSALMSKQ